MAYKYNQLPDTLFMVKVPTIYTYSDADIGAMGLPMQKDKRDRDVVDPAQMSLVMLPLTRIIDIYSSGAPISLTNPDEVTLIYNILENYLRDFNSS